MSEDKEDDRAFADAFSELDIMIGLQDIKRTQKRIHTAIKRYGLGNAGPGLYIFAGNPGTGKTSAGKLMGQIDDRKQNMAVVFAGYVGKMNGFIEGNPDMERRITKTIDFPDYTTDDLLKIFDLMVCEKNSDLAEMELPPIEMSDAFRNTLKGVLDKARKEKNFGNASYVAGLIRAVQRNHATRTATETFYSEEAPEDSGQSVTIQTAWLPEDLGEYLSPSGR